MSHHLLGHDSLGHFVLVVLGIGVLVAGVRLVRGPTIPDRIIAFDLIAVLVMGKIATIAILTDEWVFLDAVIILALLAFLATVAFATFLTTTRRWERRWPR